MDELTISNQFFSASFNLKGAELTGLTDKNTNYQFIWQANNNIWPRHAPILFPIVGKLKNNSYTLYNNSYQLHQHGFARDQYFEVLEIYEDTVSFLLNQNEQTLGFYPFNFTLIVTFQLKLNELTTTYKIVNNHSDLMPFSIGGHPGFALPTENFDEYSIKFNAVEPIKSYHLNNGLLSDNCTVLSKSGDEIALNKDSFKNDAFILKNLSSNLVQLKHQHSNFNVAMDFTGFSYFGIWSKYPSQQFICLEPWAGITDKEDSDGNLNHKEGIIWLKPNQIKEFSYKTIFTAP